MTPSLLKYDSSLYETAMQLLAFTATLKGSHYLLNVNWPLITQKITNIIIMYRPTFIRIRLLECYATYQLETTHQLYAAICWWRLK